MLKIWLVVLGVFFLLGAYAQRIDPKLDPRNFPGGFYMLKGTELRQVAFDLSKCDTLDLSKCVIEYEQRYIQDTLKKDIRTEKMFLEVGEDVTCFYSYPLYRMDSVYTANSCMKSAGGMEPYFPERIYHYINDDRLHVVSRMPFLTNISTCYEESVPTFDWKMTDRWMDMAEFRCNMATCRYGGRDWTVWFTTQIPINYGPWKFSGLPGLILKVEDSSGQYAWEMVALRNIVRPIVRYHWKTKKMTKEAWFKQEKAIYGSPYNFVSQNNTVLFLNMDSTTAPYLDEENWSAPYNPIERE